MSNFLRTVAELTRFGLVGGTAAVVHFTTVLMLVEHLGIPPLISNIVGFLIAFQVSYWGHRLFTFKGTRSTHREALPKLLTIQTINFAANESLFYFLLSLHFAYPFALLVVLTILPLFTYFTSKHWIFQKSTP